MSQVRRPLPASVYWRRRIVVFGGLLVVIAVIVLIIVRPGFGLNQAEKAPEEAELLEVVEIPNCLGSQIELVAKTDQARYAAGQLPQLWLSVTNTSTVDCRLQVGTDVQKYTITSGPDEIWVSTHCQETSLPNQVVLKAGEQQETGSISWDRSRSSPDTCDVESRRAAIANGASYHLSVSLGTLNSPTTKQFLLD
jgi:hypothetical protein